VSAKSHALPSKVDPADRQVVDAFLLENGRYPKPGDGEAYEALRRSQKANLEAQASTPWQEFESEPVAANRQKSAARTLAAIETPDVTAAPSSTPRPAPRARERSNRRSRSEQSSRSGDSGDPPRPDDLDPRPRGRRLRRARGRAS
jgi:hypothetical protein